MTLKRSLPPCYDQSAHTTEDHAIQFAGAIAGTDESAMEWCDRRSLWKPCPVGGVCKGGRLESCIKEYHRVSDAEDKCVWTEQARLMIEQAEVELYKRSEKHFCSRGTTAVSCAPIDLSPPSIKLSDLIGDSKEFEFVLKAAEEHFVIDQDENIRLLNISLPLYCQLHIFVVQWLDFFLGWTTTAKQNSVEFVCAILIIILITSYVSLIQHGEENDL